MVIAQDEEIGKKVRQLLDFRTLLMYSIISALALVVGLFWNEAIKATIEQIVPKGESLFFKYLAAIAVTVIVVITVYVIMHAQKLAEKRFAKLQEELNKNKKTQKKKRKRGMF